ncbi:DUF3850 domain-containing protein [Salmonella enterica]|nr:DUF3850 domain-containing protein [Salmonella enterica]
MNMHNLKIWPEHFAPVIAGTKRAELRKNDRNYQAGDSLLLSEWNPDTKRYAGRSIGAIVTHVTDISTWLPGYVMLSFIIESTSQQQAPDLLDIGNCLIDADLVVAVEPYYHGHHGTHTGALVHLSGGESVIEKKRTLSEVKAAIQAARAPVKPFRPHIPGMPPRQP